MKNIEEIISNWFKLASLIFFVVFIHFVSFAATITSNSSGDWSTGGTWVGGVAPVSTDDVVIATTHAITMTADAECDDLTINGTGSLIVGTNILTVNGESPGLGVTLTTVCTSELVINDSGSKGEFVIPTSVTVLQKITINRANGASCDHDLDLTSCAVPADSVVLVLTNGVLSMTPIGTSVLTMGDDVNGLDVERDIPCSDASYVDGIVQRALVSGGISTFPVGNDGLSRRFGITQNSAVNESIHEVRFIRGVPRNNTCFTGALAGGVTDKYSWIHTQTSGGNPQRSLYYEDADFSMTSAERIANLTLANGELAAVATCAPPTAPANEWRTPTTNVTVYDDVSRKFVQFDNANASNNPYWSFGSTNAALPLPVTFVGIEVECKPNHMFDLTWQTSSEKNNDYFSIEKTVDGVVFEEVGQVQGKGTSNELNTYKFEMESDLELSYLRLKQIDIDGNYEYSPLVVSNCASTEAVTFYPNPATSKLFFNGVQSDIELGVYNVSGEKVGSFQLSRQQNQINISNYTPGVYFLQIDEENALERVVIVD